MMDSTLKQKIEKSLPAAMAAVAIAKLEENFVLDQTGLDDLSDSDFLAMGIVVGIKNQLKKLQTPKNGTSDPTPSDEFSADELGITEDQMTELVSRQANVQVLWRIVTLRPLIERYNPENRNGLALYILQEALGTEPCIAFKPDSKEVAVEEVILYLENRRDTDAPRQAIMVEGQLTPLYPIGIYPWDVRREDPLCPGQPLDEMNRSITYPSADFTDVPLEVMQLVRIIVQNGEVDPAKISDLYFLMESVGYGMESLQQKYLRSAMQFRTMQERDRPALEIYPDWFNQAGETNSSSSSAYVPGSFNIDASGNFKRIYDATLDCFPGEPELVMALQLSDYHQNPYAIMGGGNLGEIVMSLLRHVRRHSDFDHFITCMSSQNPRFASLLSR